MLYCCYMLYKSHVVLMYCNYLLYSTRTAHQHCQVINTPFPYFAPTQEQVRADVKKKEMRQHWRHTDALKETLWKTHLGLSKVCWFTHDNQWWTQLFQRGIDCFSTMSETSLEVISVCSSSISSYLDRGPLHSQLAHLELLVVMSQITMSTLPQTKPINF